MRPRNIAGIAAGGVLAAVIVAYGAALLVDLGRFKPSIAEAAREATGRDLTIGGKLHLVPGFRPALALEDVSLSNPGWAAKPNMFQARRVTVAVRFLPLLLGRIELAHVGIEGAEVFLETDAEGASNWVFETGGGSTPEATAEETARAVPGTLKVRDSTVSFRDGQKGGGPLTLSLRDAEVRHRGPGRPLTAEAELQFRGGEVAIDAELPPVVDLIANRPGSIRIEAAGAGATLTAEGSVTDVRSGAGLDIAIRGNGSDLSRLTGLAVDDPFEFAAKLADIDGRYVISAITAQSGGNSLSGEASLDTGVTPPRAAASFDLKGGVTGNVRLAAQGNGVFDLLGTLAGTFEFARAGEPGTGFVVKGAISHASDARTPTTVEASGEVRGEVVSITARFGPLGSLGTSTPIPFDIAMSTQDTRFAFKGLARDLFNDARVSAAFEFESGDLGALAQSFGTTAPARAARTSGRLESAGSRFIVTGLEAVVGASDLQGEVTIEMDGPRPKVIADLTSQRLDSDDLAAAKKDAEGVAPDDSAALSDERLAFDMLRRFDAEVSYRGGDVAANGIALGQVSFALLLVDGDLKIDALEAAPSGVPLSGMLTLSTSAAPLEFKLELSAAQADFTSALEDTGVQVAAAGVESIDVNISARGDSVRDLAESLEGGVRVAGLSLRPQSDTAAAASASDGSDVALDLSLSLRGADSDITLEGEGTLGGEALTVAASLPSINALRRGGGADLSFEARAGDGFLTLEGESGAAETAAFELEGEGALLRDLGRFAGLNLAQAGPHSLAGTLNRRAGQRFELERFALVSGATDISAEGAFDLGAEKKTFDLRLTSNTFDLDDLVAAEAEAPPEAATEAEAETAAPAKAEIGPPLPLDLLRDYEGTLAVEFGEVRLGAIQFGDLSVQATLSNGTLDIPGFTAHVGGASLTGAASLAAQGDTAKLTLSFAGQGIDPGAALTDQRIAESFTTTMDTEANLQAKGATRNALVSSLSGRIQAIAGEGRFEENKYLFFETGILRQLAPWEERRDTTNLNCFVADFVVENGVAAANGLLLDTEFMSVLGKGEIDLGAETLGLTFSPRPKETRLLDLAIPVRLGGTFDKPTFLPTPGGAAKKVATTLGALVNPLVLLVPVIESTRNDKNPCVAALASAAAEVDPNAEKDKGVVGGVLKGIGRTFKRLGGEE